MTPLITSVLCCLTFLAGFVFGKKDGYSSGVNTSWETDDGR